MTSSLIRDITVLASEPRPGFLRERDTGGGPAGRPPERRKRYDFEYYSNSGSPLRLLSGRTGAPSFTTHLGAAHNCSSYRGLRGKIHLTKGARQVLSETSPDGSPGSPYMTFPRTPSTLVVPESCSSEPTLVSESVSVKRLEAFLPHWLVVAQSPCDRRSALG